MNTETARTWLITGADKGLGYQVAKTALERGDNVVVTVLAADGEHALSQQYPDSFRALHLDARDHAAIGPVVARAKDAFGRVDVLVNNAGYAVVALAEATSADKYRPLFEVNFFGLVEMTRAVLPVMRKQRSGHIMNLSSYAGFVAPAGFSFYAASKFAVEGYSELLLKEVGHLGIKVTLIEPSGFRSDFAGPSLDQGLDTLGEDYAQVSDIVTGYSSRRHGTQVNDPALFGPALYAIANADNAPLRLALGEDAVDGMLEKIRQMADDLERWRELSRSTMNPV